MPTMIPWRYDEVVIDIGIEDVMMINTYIMTDALAVGRPIPSQQLTHNTHRIIQQDMDRLQASARVATYIANKSIKRLMR